MNNFNNMALLIGGIIVFVLILIRFLNKNSKESTDETDDKEQIWKD